MIIIYLIQLILTFLLISFSRKLYDYGNYKEHKFDPDDKIKIPIIAYVGIIIDVVLIIWSIMDLSSGDIYYKPGKIVKFLFKTI